MIFAADVGPPSGRATPSLHEARHRHLSNGKRQAIHLNSVGFCPSKPGRLYRRLKDRGFESNETPGYRLGWKKFRKAHEASLRAAVNWADDNFENVPNHLLSENETGLTISQCLTGYFKDSSIMGRQINEYHSICKQFIEVIGGDIPVNAITNQHCLDFKVMMQNKPSLQMGEDRKLTLPQFVKNIRKKT